MKSYAGYYKNDIRERSSSGGIFSALAKRILEDNGVVYGVCMANDNYSAHFERATNLKDIDKMLSSKYMQASVGQTFKHVKEDLEKGLKVLFTGTICQINGLRGYLQKEYANLYCVDVICHGVPSHKLWKQYLIFREKQIGKCMELNFRSKEQGWYESGIKENTFFTPQKENPYMNLFLRDLCLRPSCYKCVCKREKQSDITLGDLWGVHQVASELNDDRGLSVIILRTDKSEQLFDEIKEHLVLKEITYQEAVLENPAEYESAKKPLGRDKFYKTMNKKSFGTLADQYLEQSFYWKLMGKINRVYHKVLRKIVKQKEGIKL